MPENWPSHDWDWVSWAEFSYPFNFSHNPAASIPCGFTADGLPVGLQIVGRRLDDAGVLRAAAAFEAASPWADKKPFDWIAASSHAATVSQTLHGPIRKPHGWQPHWLQAHGLQTQRLQTPWFNEPWLSAVQPSLCRAADGSAGTPPSAETSSR